MRHTRLVSTAMLSLLAVAAACDNNPVQPSSPTQLGYIVEPSDAAAGSAISPAVQVEVRDAAGTLVTNARDAITLGLISGTGGASLSGTRTVNAANGIATFSGLSVNKVGTGYKLQASSGSLVSDTSNTFSISPGPAAKVAFTSVQTFQLAPLPITPVVVAIQDAFGNVVTTSIDTIRVTSVPSPLVDGLRGTVVRAAIAGIATFSDLVIAAPGTYTLEASSLGLAKGQSAPIVIRLNFVELSAGGNQTCGATITSAMYCWGLNSMGEVGNGTTTGSLIPVLVAGGIQFYWPSAGGTNGTAYSCGRTQDGTSYCWGANVTGELGDGTTTVRLSPTAVTGGRLFSDLSTGGDNDGSHSCGISGGLAYCWGFNDHGQLGDNTMTPHPAPAPVSGGLSFASISAAASHTCAVTSAGAAYCWGTNASSELGDGTGTDRHVPTPVSGGLTFAEVKAGAGHSCGLTTTGLAYCWGGGGMIGDGTSSGRSVPTPVSGGLTFSKISTNAFAQNTCALTVTVSTPYCWGPNANGQIGDGTVIPRLAPTPVSGGLQLLMITAGPYHTCGVTSTGVAYCWGDGDDGRLGNGTSSRSYTPTPVRQ